MTTGNGLSYFLNQHYSYRMESLPTEVFFEVFDYLKNEEIFFSFLNLNVRLNSIVGLYPLNLDFRQMSRSKFDFICRSIRTEQVINLILSDEKMPNQCELFKKKFPEFRKTFSSLKTLHYFNTSTIHSELPCNVCSLTIRTLYKENNVNGFISNIFNRYGTQLTNLKVEGFYVFRSLTTTFSSLRELTIEFCDQAEFNQLRSFLCSTLKRLEIHFNEIEHFLPIGFDHLAKNLTDLRLSFSSGKFQIEIDIQLLKENYSS